MDYARLGMTGLEVSRICLGCMGFGDAQRWTHKWVLTEADSRPVIQKALELGINFFDTANVYSLGASEEILGTRPEGLRASGTRSLSPPRCTARCAKGRTAAGCRARRS